MDDDDLKKEPAKQFLGFCAVCGDKANGSRYGAPACLGCIVFFRRAVCKQADYRCPKAQKCEITFESRCICRFCRFQKCRTVGMNPSAIQRRDVMGPRKKKAPAGSDPGSSGTPSPWDGLASSPGPSTSGCQLLVQLERLQKKQRSNHLSVACGMDEELNWGMQMFDDVEEILHRPPFRRARKRDVNFMMRVSLIDATEWANQFLPFKDLDYNSKKTIMTEFGIAFMLVDQGAVTARRQDEEYWMLQNNTYMSPDYLKGLPPEDMHLKDVDAKRKLHPEFVLDSIKNVGCPMRRLQVDAIECAALKTILLLSHRQQYGTDNKDIIKLQNHVCRELFQYIENKHPNSAVERTGDVLLLTTSIRSTIRSCHAQTLVSDIFNLMNFNPLIRDVYIV